MSNIDEKTLNIVTIKQRADKAISSLKGILLGIKSDGTVNSNEIKELEAWVTNHYSLINKNPFKEFMILIRETISGDIPSTEIIEDLFWLCQKYESDNYFFNGVTSDLQVLHGLCHGILADGIINEKEVFDLKNWLEDNSHLSTYYPYDEIRSLVSSIVADGIVDDEEKTILKAYINQFVDIQNQTIQKQINKETTNVHISGLCSSDPTVIFKDKTFCITGVLKRGSRTSLKADIQKLGGIPTERLTKKTDYLIVGDNGNPAWAFACYGRKVEQALNMRKEGHIISLIHEFDFSDIVDDLL